MKPLLLTIAITLMAATGLADNRQLFSSRHVSTSDGLAGNITCDTTEQLLWISTAIYTNACYDLQKQQFVSWSNEPGRPLNKFFLSSRGMFFYGMSFGVRQVHHGQVTDYRKENNLLPSNEVVMIMEDNSHRIWIPTDKGISALIEQVGVYRGKNLIR